MRQSDHPITLITLPTGLRVVHRKCKGAPVDYCGVVVNAGSRDDDQYHGMAHFVEHTIFKGTKKRKSWHIINRMERVGGELNAYTTKEETVVYTAAPAGSMDRAMELISDLIISSVFPDSQLDKEREVVADEINSYLDSPAEAVYDDFEDLLFSGTTLGHNILGTSDSISRINSDVCREYLHHWYTAPNAVVFYFGAAPAERVIKAVEKHFACLPTHTCHREPLPQLYEAPHFQIQRPIGSHQAHTVMGTTVGSMYSPERFSMALLTNIIGGPGMNSILNLALREKRGLVYSVEASTSFMTDCGLFTIYFGCDPADTEKCQRLVIDELARIASGSITERMLQGAKRQYLGQLAVASDNRDSTAISTGRAALYHNHVSSSAQIIDSIMAITPEDMVKTAQRLTSLSTLTLI